MRLALLSGLLLAFALGAFASGNSTAHAAAQPGASSHTAALFSISAQAVTTATTTVITAAPTVGSATTVTATTAVTATGLVSPTATLATLPLQGQGGGSGNLQLNPFDWAFLTSAPGGLGPFSWLGLLLMAGLFGISAYFYLYKRPSWKKTNTMYYRAANRWAPVGLWLSILGLLLLLFRVIQFDFFNLRIWLYLWLLATIGAGAYFFYWYRTQYPKEVARYQKTQRARQYMPGSAKAGTRSTTGPSTSAKTTVTTKTTATRTTSTQRPASSTSTTPKKRKMR